MYAIPGVGLTLGVGFLGSKLTGMQTPEQVANDLYSLGNSVFSQPSSTGMNPFGWSGINPLSGGFASIFGNVNSQSSAQQAYQNLLSVEKDRYKMAQLFPTLMYAGEPDVNGPVLKAINSYAQQFVNSPSLWGTFSGVDPSAAYQRQQDLLQNVGQSYFGGGG